MVENAELDWFMLSSNDILTEINHISARDPPSPGDPNMEPIKVDWSRDYGAKPKVSQRTFAKNTTAVSVLHHREAAQLHKTKKDMFADSETLTLSENLLQKLTAATSAFFPAMTPILSLL